MDLQALQAVANSVRTLSMDAVEKAKSGHPGLPMGLAELGALLYGELLKHDPADPKWPNRDRLVLSAGHGCMLLYSLLHLSGYPLSLDDLKSFRQLGSKTPGHPEYGMTPGVEVTGGPLGQGLANAVGMALAESMLAAKFNTAAHKIVEHHTYVIASDGDMMEGVSSEAASLAGHLSLGKLIVFYDSNHITIEGSTDLAFSEDVLKRFESYGWRTLQASAYDLPAIAALVAQAKAAADRPTIIRLESIIGKGAPTMEGKHAVHGTPLGTEECKRVKQALGIPEEAMFHVFPAAREFFAARQKAWAAAHKDWQTTLASWKKANPELAREWEQWQAPRVELNGAAMPEFKVGESLATRAASGKAVTALSKAVGNLVGGSADLAPSNNTYVKDAGDFGKANRLGRNFHFGIREHGMGAICNGILYHGGLRPYCGTFLVFSDYMRPAIRVAAIAKLPAIYVFTHDSIFVGEDGPTHEPVEHLAALRAIPNLQVLRPADAEETAEAWLMAYERTDGPTALILSRQNLPVLAKSDAGWRKSVRQGAYVARDCQGEPELVVVASGSEVHVAVAAAAELSERRIRVLSMPCREEFARQPAEWRRKLVPPKARRLVFEAAVRQGWTGLFEEGTEVVSIERFGESGPYAKLAEHFGITAPAVAERMRKLL
ncbi:MAG: transketolase [Spirochaetes bacterium GWB1_59_5]|nr:MAG: transketolase [Spirochaetes bacterium GWB1_59_5]